MNKCRRTKNQVTHFVHWDANMPIMLLRPSPLILKVEASELLIFKKNSLFYGFQIALPNALKTLKFNYRNPFLIEFGCWSYSAVLL